MNGLSCGSRQSGRRRCSGGRGRGRSSWLSSRRHYFCNMKIKINMARKYCSHSIENIISLTILGIQSRNMTDQQDTRVETKLNV